jgi:acyl-coenzyme A thioesterase PaaI-like protein
MRTREPMPVDRTLHACLLASIADIGVAGIAVGALPFEGAPNRASITAFGSDHLARRVVVFLCNSQCQLPVRDRSPPNDRHDYPRAPRDGPVAFGAWARQTTPMTTTESNPGSLNDAQASWQRGVFTLISYRYLGTYSETKGRHDAEGWMNIRPDLRGPVGLLAAPLGIALLDTAGINVDPLAAVAPTRIEMQILTPAPDVKRMHLEGRILREGKSQFFTESRITDDADRSRLLALGITHWAVSGPNPGFNYVDNRPGAPAKDAELPPLYEPFGARVRDDGELEIAELRPELGGRGLHQGPFQVVPEQAAMRALERAGHIRYWIEHQGTSIVSRGTDSPLVTTSEVLRVVDQTALVQVELRAAGDNNRLCSVTVCRFRLV